MKKTILSKIALFLVCIMGASMLAGCGSKTPATPVEDSTVQDEGENIDNQDENIPEETITADVPSDLPEGWSVNEVGETVTDTGYTIPAPGEEQTITLEFNDFGQGLIDDLLPYWDNNTLFSSYLKDDENTISADFDRYTLDETAKQKIIDYLTEQEAIYLDENGVLNGFDTKVTFTYKASKHYDPTPTDYGTWPEETIYYYVVIDSIECTGAEDFVYTY